MAIILSQDINSQEIRILQEFRRVAADTLPIAAIKAIRHPTGGGEAPALTLLDKGWLTADATRQNFMLTQKAKDLLAMDPKPEVESGDAGEGDEVAAVE